jgi:anti-sigma factor RsiW
MAIAESHPTSADLEAFVLGTLDNPALADVEAHVADCPACQERAATASGDSLVELLRRVHPRKPGASDTVTAPTESALTPAPLLGKEGMQALVAADAVGPEAVASVPPELAQHERYRVLNLLGEGGMGVFAAVAVVGARKEAGPDPFVQAFTKSGQTLWCRNGRILVAVPSQEAWVGRGCDRFAQQFAQKPAALPGGLRWYSLRPQPID